jgi:hypothetical protein
MVGTTSTFQKPPVDIITEFSSLVVQITLKINETAEDGLSLDLS